MNRGDTTTVAVVESLEPRLCLTAAGTPDPAFANGTTPILGPGNDFAYAVAALPDGRYLVAGSTEGSVYDRSTRGTAVVRYLPDGMVDPSFGRAGQVFLSDGYDRRVVMAVQADGKILLGVSTYDGSEILRLLPGG